MQKKNTKERLFEVMSRVVPDFKVINKEINTELDISDDNNSEVNNSEVNKEPETINEYPGEKFFTGHKNSDDLEQKKNAIIKNIDDNILKMQNYPDSVVFDGGSPEKTKEMLIKQAEDNNWKGGVKLIKAPNNGKFYLRYQNGFSPLQSIGSAAAVVNMR